MKSFLVILILCMCVRQVDAQKVKDQEFRHVVVTLTSGEKVEGYVKRGWHAEASNFKKSNYSFKMTATPEDKEVLKYTADEVISIDLYGKDRECPRRYPLGITGTGIALHFQSLPHDAPSRMFAKSRRTCFRILVEGLGCYTDPEGRSAAFGHLLGTSFPR